MNGIDTYQLVPTQATSDSSFTLCNQKCDRIYISIPQDISSTDSCCCDSGSGFPYLLLILLLESSMWFPLTGFFSWSHFTLAHNSQEGIALLNPLTNSPLFKEGNSDSIPCHLGFSPSFPQPVFLLATYLFFLYEPAEMEGFYISYTFISWYLCSFLWLHAYFPISASQNSFRWWSK